MPNQHFPQETTDFIFDRLHDIAKVQELKTKVIEAFRDKCLHYLQEQWPERTISSKIHHWWGYPALHFSFADWSNASKVTLFLDARENHCFRINYFCCALNTDEQRERAIQHLTANDCTNQWRESKDTVIGFSSSLPDLTSESMMTAVERKLSLLDTFEQQVRPV